MEKIFISYGTDEYKETLIRLKKEATEVKIFDKIIVYTPSDLPDYIKNSPLIHYKKGGGFWLWKPFIIWKTLQQYKNAIVIYVDAGCSIRKSEDWQMYFEQIKKIDSIVFKYRKNFDYGWKEIFNTNSIEIKTWTKERTLKYFDKLFENKDWRTTEKVMGGFIISKGHNNVFINQWLNISLFKPELIMDEYGNEINDQNPDFVGHRHDQSIITPLANFYGKEVLILPETSESKIGNPAVLASRIRNIKQTGRRKIYISRAKNFIRKLLTKKM